MTFVDTSAWYALADRRDANHGRAGQQLAALVESGEPLLTHNYVLVETTALLQQHLGLTAALALAHDTRLIEIEWITAPAHADALRLLATLRRRKVSFVDAVSFQVMKARGVSVAFAFDPHFEDQGFQLVDA